MIATPSEGSKAPITRISTVVLPEIFVTLITSPGRYPTVFAKSPSGNSPSAATKALPSKDGLKDARSKDTDTTDTIFNKILPNLDFIFPPVL